MNEFLNKLEKKFGHLAIPNLIRYIIILDCVGAFIAIVNPELYYEYLVLDIDAVLHGQVWRLFTFLLEPHGYDASMGLVLGILFFIFQVNLFLLMGRSLEYAWGSFRFNLYFLTGYIFNILAAVILYLTPLEWSIYDSGLYYIFWSMFFAFAMLNPDLELLLMGVLPIKAKWLGILSGLYMGYDVIRNVRAGIQYLQMGGLYSFAASLSFGAAIAVVVAMMNFLIFYFSSRNFQRIRPKEIHRRREFKRKTQQSNRYEGGARHRCAICGRTELDDYSLDFRYCSKCEGNYEYCSEHLFTHQHVKKFM